LNHHRIGWLVVQHVVAVSWAGCALLLPPEIEAEASSQAPQSNEVTAWRAAQEDCFARISALCARFRDRG